MRNKNIGIWTYLPEYKKEKKQIFSAINRVFESGRLILGEEVALFEKEFAEFCNTKYGIGVNSGTDAIFLALKALDIKEGDEVITVPNTAIPTVSAICTTGATPVFVDIDTNTYLMDVSQLESKITPKTKCIVPVHLYGQACDMGAILKIARKHKLFVVEDCAQATGAKWQGKPVGSFSDLAAFSFYPTKVLGTYGDGGMIITNSAKLARKLKMIRMYGTDKEYYSEFMGYNSRLDEIHAAVLRYKLKKISYYIKQRIKIAKKYNQALSETSLTLPYNNPLSAPVYYLYVCRHKKRDKIIEDLKKENILINVSYRHPLHTMKAFRFLGYKKGDFPITEKVTNEIFSIPIYPEFSKEDQNKVMQILKKILSTY